MGYLHEGHMSLVREARKMADIVVVSIFVNPAQFAPNEDLERYPRDVTRDAEMLTLEKVDHIFLPKAEEMYPPGFHTYVKVRELGEILEGVTRPTHFEGVATIVMKLFHIVDPHFAYFGQKDAQQLVLIRRMVMDMNMDVEILRLPIVRETDGLAMSSRNVYLTPEERAAAPVLYRSLQHAQKMIADGERKTKNILKEVREIIEAEPLARLDYIAAVDMTELKEVKTLRGKNLIALAAYFGSTRLIDNIIVEV
jgi:pantoate--beta-alanine ligase